MSYRNYAWAAAVKSPPTPCLVAEEKAVTEAPCPARGLTLEQFQQAGALANVMSFLHAHKEVRVLLMNEHGLTMQMDAGLATEMLRAGRWSIETRLKEFGMEEPT